MNKVNTKYGYLSGISSVEKFSNGQIKECTLSEENELITCYGKFIPQYRQDNIRRKYISSICFYKNGNIKSISLNSQTNIKTELGIIAAEKVTFYEDGSIKRIFPLDGKLTGYWTEEDEYALAREYEFKFLFATFKCKVIGIKFYRNQNIESITLWPKEHVKINSTLGNIDIRIGMSLYQNGNLKSCEPAEVTPINTSIGTINAYDINALGINGDTNSLNFYEDSTLKSIVTSTDKIEVVDKSNNKIIYLPIKKPSLFDPIIKEIIPITIKFYDNKVKINDKDEYEIDKYLFTTTYYLKNISMDCSDCSTCSLCK